VLAAIIIFLVGVIIIRIADKFAARALEKSKLEKGLRSFIRSGLKLGLWVLVIIIVADKLGIPSATLVAALSVVGLALSLSLQNILENIFSGFTILFTKPFVSGDYVELDSVEGTITSIRLFYTTVLTYDKKKIYVPNSEIVATKVINCTNEPIRRVDRAFGLSYDCPTDKVRGALLAAAAAEKRILKDPAPEVRLTAYNSSNIEFTLVSWVKSEDYWGVFFDINESVREYINAAGLSMSFDRVDVRITEKHQEQEEK